MKRIPILSPSLNGPGGTFVNAAWMIFIPLWNPDKQEISYPKGLHNCQIGKHTLRAFRYENNKKYLTDDDKTVLRSWCYALGVKRRVIPDLCNMTLHSFKVLDEFIAGIVDSLWLTDDRIFTSWHKVKVVRGIIRSVIHVFTYNRYTLMDQWKNFTAYLVNKYTERETPKEIILSQNNPFKILLSIGIFKMNHDDSCERFGIVQDVDGVIRKVLKPYITTRETRKGVSYDLDLDQLAVDRPELLDNVRCKHHYQLLERVAHMSSTRQMPYLGKKTELKALKAFEEVITSRHDVEPFYMELMKYAAYNVGVKCRRIKKMTGVGLDDRTLHFSLSSAADFTNTIRDGGKAKQMMNDVKSFLTAVPEATFTKNYPIIGNITFFEGKEPWRYLFRDNEILNGTFMEPRKEGIPDATVVPCYWGIDEYLGKQIYLVALDFLQRHKRPPVRTSTVCELGNKARVITIAPWWLNVIQSPIAHAIKDELQVHPAVFSSFHKADQTWHGIMQFSRMFSELPIEHRGYRMLSSDLKDATNAQSIELTKALLKYFLMGMGYTLDTRTPTEYVIDLIGERDVYFPDGHQVLLTRGVLMGEPLAKVSLTILNLAVEEAAFILHQRKLFPKIRMIRKWFDSPYNKVVAPWRFCHIGGDDHIAYGPDKYLSLITSIHQKCGSIISEDKHGVSKLGVKYCEKFIYLGNGIFNTNVCPSQRFKGLTVDSIKIRLMTPGLTTMAAKDNTNPTIGKAQYLMKILKWMPRCDDEAPGWSQNRLERIKAMWKNRFRRYLPSDNERPDISKITELPTWLGGLDLSLKSFKLPQDSELRFKEMFDGINLVILTIATGLYKTMSSIKHFERNISKDNYSPNEKAIFADRSYELTTRMIMLRGLIGKYNQNQCNRGVNSTSHMKTYLRALIQLRKIPGMDEYPINFSEIEVPWRQINSEFRNDIKQLIRDVPNPEMNSWEIPDVNQNRYLFEILRKRGIYMANEYIDWASRPNIFESLMFEPERIRIFNKSKYPQVTENLLKRIKSDPELNQILYTRSFITHNEFDDLENLIMRWNPLGGIYLDTNELVKYTTTINGESEERETTVKDFFNLGRPCLVLSKHFFCIQR